MEKLHFVGTCKNSRCNQMIYSFNQFDDTRYCVNCSERLKGKIKQDRVETRQKTLSEVTKNE